MNPYVHLLRGPACEAQRHFGQCGLNADWLSRAWQISDTLYVVEKERDALFSVVCRDTFNDMDQGVTLIACLPWTQALEYALLASGRVHDYEIPYV